MDFIPGLDVIAAFTLAALVLLVWLAIQAIRHGSALTLSPESGERRSLGKVFAMGIGINLLNPKIVMFFLTFLPQFVSAGDAQASGKLLFLGLYFIVVAIPNLQSAHRRRGPVYACDATLAARHAGHRLSLRITDGCIRPAPAVRADELTGTGQPTRSRSITG